MSVAWFFINLDRSKDRLAMMNLQLSRMGISATRVAAIDGDALSLDHPDVDHAGFWRDSAMRLRTTDAACYLSHLKAMRSFLDTGTDYAVILEDDIVLSAATVGLIRNLTAESSPRDWDMVRLTGNNTLRALTYRPIEDGFHLGVYWTRLPGAAGYLINRKAAQRYLDKLRPMTVLFDHAFDRGWVLGLEIRVIVPLPASGLQSPFSRNSTIDTADRRRLKNRGLGKATSLWWRTKSETRRFVYAVHSYARLKLRHRPAADTRTLRVAERA